jgi:hypothetical protein
LHLVRALEEERELKNRLEHTETLDTVTVPQNRPKVGRPHPLLTGRGRRVVGTNLQNKGLISADRGTKATLMRTIPRSLFKSYTKDLLFPIFELVFQHRLKLL